MPSPMKFLVRNNVESKIKKELRKGNLENLRTWLDIAGQNDNNVPKKPLQFTFKDNSNLISYSIAESNQLLRNYRNYPEGSPWHLRLRVFLGFTSPVKQYLLPSQRLIKQLFLLEQENLKPLPPKGLWKRFRAWSAKKLAVPFEFIAADITVETVAKEFREKGIPVVEGTVTPSKVRKANTPISSETTGISEHYTNTEILDRPKLIKKRLDIPVPLLKFNAKVQKKTPSHLENLIEKTQLSQVIAVEKLNQQIQQQQLNQAIELIENNLLAPVQLQVEQFVDNSTQQSLDTFTASLQHGSISQWLKNFREECKRLSKMEWYPHITITQDAQDVLNDDEAFPFNYQQDIDLNELPLGFFIDKGRSTFVLKFSQELRKKQLKEGIANLRLDPASTAKDKNIIEIIEVIENEPLEVLEKKLFDELRKHNIDQPLWSLQRVLEFAKHKGPLDVYSSHGDKKYRYDNLLPSIYKQFHRILLEAGPEHFLSLLVQMDKMSRVESKQYAQWSEAYKYGFKQKKCSLLDNFLGAYFPDNHPIAEIISKELCQPDTLIMLNNLAQPNNKVARQLFTAIISAKKKVTFNKAYNAAMAVQNHFNSLQINITDELLRSVAGSSFESLANMINLSSHSSLPALQIQLTLAGKAPTNTVLCTRLLDQGYSFVVECMDLSRYSRFVKEQSNLIDFNHWSSKAVPLFVDDKFINNTKQEKIKLDEQNTMDSCFNPYFQVWFRYLAYNVDLHYVAEAIEKWKSLMGEDSLVISIDRNFNSDRNNLKKHWEELVDFVVKLPKKMDLEKVDEKQMGYAKQEKDTGLINKQIVNQAAEQAQAAQAYSVDDAIKLCETQLDINDEEKDYIKDALEELNNVADRFSQLSQTKMLELAQNLKNTEISNESKAQIEALALLRELNYRWTLATSKSDPQKGEWLRMEQALAILLTMREPAKLFQIDTSEGKTLIISLSALMHALQGKKTNIYTHNELFADEYVNKLRNLTQMLDLRLADKNSGKDEQLDADIFCIDISSAVIQHTLDRYEGNPSRDAQIDLADEIDNQLDIQANTTMQISESQNDEEYSHQQFEADLMAMCRAYTLLKDETECSRLEDQIAFIQDRLKNENLEINDERVCFWLAKIANADQKKLNQDYIIDEEKRIRIVHSETTGRVDRLSQWGDYFHQCVGALEKLNNPGIVIEPLTDIVAEGSISNFYKGTERIRYGFTGTLGEQAFAQKMSEVLNTKKIIIMPRAARPNLEEANWPLISDAKGGSHPQYNRSYRFAPIICENDESYFDSLIEMVCKIREENQSAIIFFNTIEECEEFNQILLHSEEQGPVQIFDDTNISEDNEGQIKKSQKASILHANTPKMITLTTAAGSRGTDFNSVSVGIIATPGLARVVDQKAGRIGRNAQFGIVYEVYSMDQLDQSTQEFLRASEMELPKEPEKGAEEEGKHQKANLRVGIDDMEIAKQAEELNQLAAREPLDAFKEKVQLEYSKLNCKSPKWGSFFASIKTDADITELEKDWNKLKIAIEVEKNNKMDL